jgi:nitrate reductase gamma subunit
MNIHDIYNFVSGPLVWVAFLIFIFGSLYRIIGLILLAYKKERFIFSFMSFKYSIRSILHWMTPFAATNMRKHPVMNIVTVVFHISLIFVPIFLLSHIILLDESWNISWWAIPDRFADILTMIVIISCIFFLFRRIKLPEAKFVTTFSDFILLAIVSAPFISGFWAYHQFPGYPIAMILHILSGEIMLIAIPFTRLSHMLFAVFTRAYMGSEFGSVRHVKDW